MAISVSFRGSTIYRPGSYSYTTIDQGGNTNLSPTGRVYIFGEADAGAPGAQELNIANNVFTGDLLADARAKYRSGPILDALSMLFSPAADGAIPNGAQSVWIYKTNNSTKASKVLSSTYGTVESNEFGVGGNRITYKCTLANDGQTSISGTPPALGTALDSATVSFRVNGDAPINFAFSADDTDHDTIAKVVIELNANVAFNAKLIASSSGAVLTIKTKLNADKHQDGFGDCFEIVSGSALLGMTAALNVPTAEPTASIVLNQKRDLLTESDVLGGNVVVSIGRSNLGGATSASVTVNATQILLTDSVEVITLTKADFTTMKQLVDAINLYPGWTAALASPTFNSKSPSVLDQVVVGAFSAAGLKPARIKMDAYEVSQFFAAASIASILNQAVVGLPDTATEAFLAGGSKGATASSDIIAALSKAEKFHVNFILPLFSRDATADIADSLTDDASSYTIDGITAAVKNHISMMRSIKKRSERQAVLSFKGSWEDCKVQAAEIAEGSIQLVVQDIRQVDSQGVIKWFQPWAMASLVTGMRCGGSIGLPMTFKYMNCSGIRHTGQGMNVPESQIVMDFDPDTQYEDAIQSGITFAEAPSTGGYRIVVDNTTYGVDENWVYNRANVIYGANIVAYNFRNALEQRYVGVKSNIRASEVKSFCESVLNTFLAQGITVSTGTAPNGFRNLSVRISGNTIYVSVTITLVEGIDFILSEITVERATQTA
jgi:hypothetical protein